MITKDIALEDCILDLIDNCLDGAGRVKHAEHPGTDIENYTGFRREISFREDQFRIVDNCGGISIAEAIDYAFHFGRRVDAPTDGDYSIGLYGIGMKRAIFKIGNTIEIHSSTKDEAFATRIDVKEWLARPPMPVQGQAPREDWDFEMFDEAVSREAGTSISVGDLYSPISMQFSNPEFENGLARIVSRDYARFLSKGFEISINGSKVPGFEFKVRQGDDMRPIRQSYIDETGVKVELIAGMAAPPPDDLEPTDRRPETDYYGWFVICNERVIVASNKTDRTVWGDGDFQIWHPQYYGFIGVISFSSKDPNLLPWTTTKRDVDRSNPTYRRAIEKMKDATRSWIKYTNDRKGNIGAAKQREASTTATPLFYVPANVRLEVPQVTTNDSSLVSLTSIQYRKPSSVVRKAKQMLGNVSMSNSRLGEMTFVKLSRIVDLSSHLYVGLGSLWFVDFLMAHKLLGISSMKSIESTEIGLSRSVFNCPLSCIDVIFGDSTEVIPTLNLQDRPSLVWFDYDSSIGGPAIRDIAMIVSRVAPNSVLIVTINAKQVDLPTKDENDAEIDVETSLRRIAGDLVPTPLPPKRLQKSNYPKLLCEVLSNQMQSATANSGRRESFVKLFDLVYSDGTPMATVGGVIAAPDKVDAIRQLAASPGWEGILASPISIPPLTIKEKIALDRMMPSANPPTDAQMTATGFQLKREQIDMYHRHYLHYPMFGEFFW